MSPEPSGAAGGFGLAPKGAPGGKSCRRADDRMEIGLDQGNELLPRVWPRGGQSVGPVQPEILGKKGKRFNHRFDQVDASRHMVRRAFAGAASVKVASGCQATSVAAEPAPRGQENL